MELATLSVLQSFKHFPHHMVVPALRRDFPPPMPHVPEVGTCKIELASTEVLISPLFISIGAVVWQLVLSALEVVI